MTQSWPLRCHTTYLGIIIVNTERAWVYENNHDKRDFKEILKQLGYDLMHNTIDAEAQRQAAGTPGSPPRRGGNHFASPDGEPPPRQSPRLANQHRAIPIASLKADGYVGGPAQQCAHCPRLTSSCCNICSTPDVLVAICPATTTYGGKCKLHDCLTKHREDPTASKRVRPSGHKRPRSKAQEEE